MESDSHDYYLCLVNTNEDLLIITKESCIICLETKLKLTVLKKWSFSKKEVSEIRSYLRRRPIRVRCICDKEN